MKIKTITCHDVYNAGASLQAYALSKYLTDLGNEVEIIDYKPDYLSRNFKLFGVSNSKFNKPILRELYNILKFPGRLKARLGKRKREFDKFTSLLPLTKVRYKSNSDLKQNSPDADVYFAGSDQIWNTKFNNGKDSAFYLDFAPNHSIKASYAASFATEDILEEYKPQIKDWISNLDYISVRESSGVSIINNLGIDGAQTVMDPVFLLDAEDWRQIEKNLNLKQHYILVYDFDKSDAVKTFVLKKAKEENLKIYSIQKCDYADKCFWNEGPAAFINLVRNADFIVSNSFHATAFSLIFKKQFVVFNRKEKINTRMQDLLNMLVLDKQIIYDQKSIAPKIDYSFITIKLGAQIEKSKEFINVVLS